MTWISLTMRLTINDAETVYSVPDSEGTKAATEQIPTDSNEKDRVLLMSMFLHYDPNHVPDWLAEMNRSPLPSGTETYHPRDIDIVIDDQGHTAVTLGCCPWSYSDPGSPPCGSGADARRLNYSGESALIRAVKVTNNYENQTFHDLLELLHDAIPLIRLIKLPPPYCFTAGDEDCEKAARYYMEGLLAWIARLADGYVLGPDDKASGTAESPTQNRRLTDSLTSFAPLYDIGSKTFHNGNTITNSESQPSNT